MAIAVCSRAWRSRRIRPASIGAAVTNLSSFTGTTDIPSFIPDYFGGERIPMCGFPHHAVERYVALPGSHFRIDALAAFFLVVINLGGAAASLYGLGYGRHEHAPHRVLPFFPAFLAGMNLVVLADDFKADKLTFGAAKNALLKVRQEIRKEWGDGVASIQLFSAPKRMGVEEAQLVLAGWLDLLPEEDELRILV